MQTVLSDLEVEAVEHDGHLWHMAYPVKDSDEVLIVATTRPETMLGDTGVAVHPEDTRYQHLIGKHVILPLVGREIPIVADDILVDMEFGTGCVKVTPAHDFNDFETGKRHNLDTIAILDKHACINDAAPEKYRGMDRYEAREAVIADLEAAGHLEKIEDHKMNVGVSQRSGEVVEPMLSKQWFVRADVLAKEAIRVVEDGEIQIIPKSWEKTYFHWMYNIRDWCISRQLWWGHRIPAWYCSKCGSVTVSREDATECGQCGSDEIEQDADVLDTWFSSGLWPFSTLGWPDNTKALKTFYPNSVMETGHDILFFWVARMIMLGCRFMDEIPFKHVYLHAMVRDGQGQKMSKTKGNVVDPLSVVDKHGADALRFTLAALTVAGRSIKLSDQRLAGYRNFATKVWNASRFVLLNFDDYDLSAPAENLSAADQWILTKLATASDVIDGQLKAFDFGAAASTVYQFIWHELCDWYIEFAKIGLQGADRIATQHTLRRVLDGALRMLHPFMPHLTEEIWQRLPRTSDDASALIVSSYALPELATYPESAQQIDAVCDVVSALRTIRGENQISPSATIKVIVNADATASTAVIEAGRAYIERLGRADLRVEQGLQSPKGSAVMRAGRYEVIVPLEGLVDFDEERKRLAKVIKKLEVDISKTEKKLSNSRFLDRAPADVVQKERAKLSQFQASKTSAQQALARLS